MRGASPKRITLIMMLLFTVATFLAGPAITHGETICNTKDPCKVTLGDTSEESPALATFDDRLYLAWTGEGNHNLNVMSSVDGVHFESKVVLSDTSEGSPALAVHQGRLYLAWTGEGDHNLNVMSSVDGVHFEGKVVLGDTSEGSPALAVHQGQLYLAWTGEGDHNLNVMSSVDGVHFEGKVVLGDTSEGSPALAVHQERLYLAWTGEGDHNLNVMSSADGVQFANKIILSDTSEGSPALTNGRERLYLAWTGEGDHNLNVMSSVDGVQFTNKITLGDTSEDTPALAAYAERLYLAWTGEGNHNLNVEDILEDSGVLCGTPIQLSSDPYTTSDNQHKTEVEPDTFSFGSTIIAAFQVGRFITGGASNIGWATSTDDGVTWTSGMLPGIVKLEGGAYDRVTDSSVVYDARHTVWLIASNPLINQGSVDAVPRGAAIVVNRSMDGGHSWSGPGAVASTNTGDFDKDWIVCDNTPTSPHYGNCYTEWEDASPSARDLIYMSTSTDGGLTWGPARNAADGAVSGEGVGGQPVVLPNGTVVVPFVNAAETALLVFTSTDGGASWGSTSLVETVLAHHADLSLGPENFLRSKHPLPSVEVDGAGKVYVVWQDCQFRTVCTANDIVMKTSTDGINWSPAVRIPIDDISLGFDHFIPGLAVDRATSGNTTHLGLAYYYYPQANCDLFTCQLNVGFISSNNGGVSWSAPNQLIGPMSLRWLPQTSQGRMVGDYISTSFSANGTAHPVFAVAKTPVSGAECAIGAICDEAIYTIASGLNPVGGTIPASSEGMVATRAGTIATPLNGGTLLTRDNRLQITFLPNAVISPTLAVYTRLDAPTHPLLLGSSALRSFTLDADTIDGQPITHFLQPYTMVISYTTADLAALGVSETSLKLAFWDSANNHWTIAPANIDTVSHRVTASLNHFTEFVLMGSQLLDDFNRPNGALGPSWFGRIERDEYRIVNQQLRSKEGGTIYWQPTSFVAAQEAFVTLQTIDSKNSRESLLLKVQGEVPNVRNGAIEVRYYAKDHEVRVQVRAPNQDWQVLAILPVTFVDGDQFGARALADGKVQIYRNGQIIGEVDTGSVFVNIGGRIGLRCTDADDTILDDFGGGSIKP